MIRIPSHLTGELLVHPVLKLDPFCRRDLFHDSEALLDDQADVLLRRREPEICRKIQHLHDHMLQPLGLLDHDVQLFPVRIFARQFLYNQACKTADGDQRSLHVVGNAGEGSSHGGEALGIAQPLLPLLFPILHRAEHHSDDAVNNDLDQALKLVRAELRPMLQDEREIEGGRGRGSGNCASHPEPETR